MTRRDSRLRGWLSPASILGWAFTAAYFAVMAPAAARMALGYDELFTYYVAAQPSVGAIWRSLLGGMDNHPPLDYLVRHLFLLIPISPEIALRLPSIIAGFGTVVTLFFCGRALQSTVAGLFAAVLVMAGQMFATVLEARSYAVSMFCGALFIWFWLLAVRSGWSSAKAIAGIGVSAAAAASLHYYGAFLLGPLGVGLLCAGKPRTLRCRAGRWGAFGMGVAGVAGVLPFALRARGYSAHFWAAPVSLWEMLKTPTLAAVLLSVLTIALLRRRRASVFSAGWPTFVVISLMAVTPFVQWAVARLATNAYLPRYSSSALPAGYLLMALAGGAVITKVKLPAAIVVAGCVLAGSLALYRFGRIGQNKAETIREVESLEQAVAGAPVPILAADPMRYLVQFHYGSPLLRNRLILPLDPEASVRHTSTDTNDIALSNLARFVPLRVEPYNRLIPANTSVMLTRTVYDRFVWLPRQLRQDGYAAQPSGIGALPWHFTLMPGARRSSERRNWMPSPRVVFPH